MTRTNRFSNLISRDENGLSATIAMNTTIEYVTTKEEEKTYLHGLTVDDLKELIKTAERAISIIESNEEA
jgi:hypothetical protein